ncbi:ATP-dependent DNA helicase Hel308 [uncultured archaeon]|nr:ATP-dependent DNA helicase Hel308 [uncultured archaeon]
MQALPDWNARPPITPINVARQTLPVEFAEKIRRLKALAQDGNSRALKETISYLNDGEPAVRAQAAICLSSFKSDASAKALHLALLDSDSAVRCLACSSLAEIGGKTSLEPLYKLAETDSDLKVREYARKAAIKIAEARPVAEFQVAGRDFGGGGAEEDEEETQEFVEPERKPVFAEMELDPAVQRILEIRGIEKLYGHQVKAVELVRQGKNVVVTAPTASGKTEIFLIPVVDAAREGRRSLIIYPTKALSRDQLERFREFSILGVRTEVYDGDTPQHAREKIRKDFPHALITNFDMLHFMLMNYRNFSKFFRSLEFVVIDEIHTCSGSFGAHAANIIRRLKRVAKSAGNPREIRFICSSATIGNAKEFSEMLCGSSFEQVEATAAPRAKVKHVIANPPIVSRDKRSSYTSLSMKLARKLVSAKGKVLIFGNSHSVVERLGVIAAREGFPGFKVYRSGLSHKARKGLENDFRGGNVRVLATTSALELGMDIGSVDSVILAGYPGTVSRVRQRVGRCGRKGQESTAVFVALDNPLDQYFVENPEKYLNGAPESCYANPENELILKAHLLATMRDVPMDEEEVAIFSKAGPKLFEGLKAEELCKPYAGGWIPTKKGLILLRTLSIRGAGEQIRIIDFHSKEQIGERAKPLAIKELFPGAIYLHGGTAYVSRSLNLVAREAVVERVGLSSEYTVALTDRTAEVIEEELSRPCVGGGLHFGKLHIFETVVGFVRKNCFTDETIEKASLEEPLENEFDTEGVWIDFPEKLVSGTSKFGEGLHAVEHSTIAMVPALSGADSSELGGISYPSGRMFIYDGTPLGSGVTRIVFARFEEMLGMARERLKNCKCKKGCPSCVLDPQCGNNNRFLDKEAAKEMLEKLKI